MAATTRAFLAGAAVLLVSFGAVALGLTKTADLAVTRWIQQAAPWLDAIASLDTIVGQSTVNAAVALALFLILVRRHPRRRAIAPLLIGAVVLIELAGKMLLAHPGPPPELVRALGNPLGIHFPTPSSFPSGHVARTTFLAILGAALARNRLVTIALGAIVLVTPPLRIYLGDHWLSDTVGALGLGVAVGALAVRLLEQPRGPASG